MSTSKVLDARRRGATTEPYGAIRCKPVESLQVERDERSKATVPFDFAQDRESFDFAQDRESFDFAQDREPVERPVEGQMMPCWRIRVSQSTGPFVRAGL